MRFSARTPGTNQELKPSLKGVSRFAVQNLKRTTLRNQIHQHSVSIANHNRKSKLNSKIMTPCHNGAMAMGHWTSKYPGPPRRDAYTDPPPPHSPQQASARGK